MVFLTSPVSPRPRGMVVKLRMYIDIKKSLHLFDSGFTIAQSKGKLIKMNVPTALRCMKVHGQLSKVEFLIDSLAATAEMEQCIPENYLPMAEIQLGSRGSIPISDDCMVSSSAGVRSDVKQAETVIAPAFLACRAWQSGILPLLEDGTFQQSASLGLVLNRQFSHQERIDGDDNEHSILRIDAASLMRYWLGGTIVELLDGIGQSSSWVDPFTLCPRHVEALDGSNINMASEFLSHENVAVDSIEGENDMSPSPIKILESSLEPALTDDEDGGEESQSLLNPQNLLVDARMEHSASHDDQEAPKRYDTPSEDGNASDEGEMRIFHQSFGVGSMAIENRTSISLSYSRSSTTSALVTTTCGSINPPTSNLEPEGRATTSQRSMSLGEDLDVNSVVGYLTDASSGPGPDDAESPETPPRQVTAPPERSSPEKINGHASPMIQSSPLNDTDCSPTGGAKRIKEAKQTGDMSETSCQLLSETLDASFRDANEITLSHQKTTQASLAQEATRDLLKGLSVLDIAESENAVEHRDTTSPRLGREIDSDTAARLATAATIAASRAARREAKKAAKKEKKRRKREAKLRAEVDGVHADTANAVSQAPEQTVLRTESEGLPPQPTLSVPNVNSEDGQGTYRCYALTKSQSKRAKAATPPATPNKHSSKKRKGPPPQGDASASPRHSKRSRRRARELKEKQLGLLKNLEAAAWDREQTLTNKNRTVIHLYNSIVGDSWVLYLHLSITVEEDELVYDAIDPRPLSVDTFHPLKLRRHLLPTSTMRNDENVS
ncbi:hypothetical protein J7T55_003761 [Diaporthe amygdali]|uniref:uncharacterized protein n=1 Tax=Phomopsis amygdali TaxID=1214568 RepID=UPI0022FE93D1|nr:uncharacterized protein J7T55_003761 [Diaporthe amygdali]KAJ0117347.1 hypothetical protein J7T55_003761 [Diaporthe amygdali]